MNSSTAPSVFIIVLNYNGIKTAKKCLQSIFDSHYANLTVVVVDNASTDGSLELIRTFFSRSHIIVNQENLGFAAGTNIGIRYALERMAEYVFLLNNDAYFEPGSLEESIQKAQALPNFGIGSPLITDSLGKSWFAGGHIDWLRMRSVHDTVQSECNPYQTDFISGCAMLVHRDVFRDIGLFDERFFLYYEDADLGYRAKQQNFSLWMIPSARVGHSEQSNDHQEEKTYWLVLSGLIFFSKNGSLITRAWFHLSFMLRRIRNWYRRVVQKNTLSRAVLRAYNDYRHAIKN